MRIGPVLAVNLILGCTAFSPSAAEEVALFDSGFIVDTSIKFSTGAREHFVSARGPYGLPSFQQGFVENMHYRIDPDGGALFSRDPRLRKGVIEIECDGSAASCVAQKGMIRLSVDAEGRASLSLEPGYESDDIYVGYGEFVPENINDNWKKLNLSLSMVTADYLADYSQLAVARDGKLVEQVSLDGFDVVEAYLKWVRAGQPENEAEGSQDNLTDKSTPKPASEGAAEGSSGNGGRIFNAEANGGIFSPLVQFVKAEPEPSESDRIHAKWPVDTNNARLLFQQIAPNPGIDLANFDVSQLLQLQVQSGVAGSVVASGVGIIEPLKEPRPVLVAAQSGPAMWDGLKQSHALPQMPNIGGKICKPAILSAVSENRAIGVIDTRQDPRRDNQAQLKYSDPSEALKGLAGIYVFTDYLAEPVHLKGKFSGRVRDEIKARLRAGGIKVLTKEELKHIPGQPRMEVYFSKANVKTGCSFAVWISVRQSILLGRNKEVRLLSGTWGSGGAHLQQFNKAPEFNTIMNHVDRFIADFKKANS